jgi:serine/threonine protein kinase/Flp pilus assembly protein TadD
MSRTLPTDGPLSAADPRLAEWIDELAGRLRSGESLELDACAGERPEHADDLRRLWPTLLMLADCSRPTAPRAPAGAKSSGPAPGCLGDYRILREVGRGGMGVVYEAEQMSLGRRVALKVLPFAAALDPRQLQRFQNEARAAAGLEHPHIVPVYGVGREGAVHFYAMKFIDGGSLAAFLGARRAAGGKAQPRGRLYFEKVARMGLAAAEALEYAHSVGVVHRDVKPANLMLDVHGKLWVADFGLARTAQSDLTMTGDLVGTLRYMSPEQAQAKHGLVDHRTDVYSLGATLYELLTLRPAVAGADREEILRDIAMKDPVNPRKIDPAIPIDLETIVLTAMAKSPRERYAQAADFAADLARFLRDEPIRARRPSLLQRARRWSRRHRPELWSLAAGLLLTLLVLAGGLGWVVRDRAARARKTIEGAQAALADARHWLRRRDWRQGLAAAYRAKVLLDSGGEGADLRQSVREVEEDLLLASRLEEIRLLRCLVRDGAFDFEGGDQRYAAAFREQGIDVEALPAVESVARLGARTARVELAAALDGWAQTRRRLPAKGRGGWRRLLEVAQGIDPDPLRKALRQAILRGDSRAMLQRAASEEIRALPPVTLVLLAECLAELAGAEAAKGKLPPPLAAHPVGSDPEQAGLEAAAWLLRRAQEDHPDDFWVNHTLGHFLLQQRPPRWNEAVPFFTAAVSVRPDSPGARLNLGYALAGAGRLAEALAAYHRATELKPDYAEAHSNFGESLRQLGHLDDAIPALRQAVQLSPRLAVARHSLGVALTQRGWLDEAVAVLRQAAAARPRLPRAHFDLGFALWRKGCLDEAAAAFRRAIELEPRYAEAHCNLGQVLRRQGAFREALASLERGHSLGSPYKEWTYPSEEWVEQCRRQIELDGRLDAILRGEARPVSPAERAEYAEVCSCKGRYAAAARLWAEAFREAPGLALDVEAGRRYYAARAAALAGSGKDRAEALDEGERARWRRQALTWLTADLAARAGRLGSDKAADREAVREKLEQWRYDVTLAGLRDPPGVEALPREERQACVRFWRAVEGVLEQVGRLW